MMAEKIDRRQFMEVTAVGTSGALLIPQQLFSNKQNKNGMKTNGKIGLGVNMEYVRHEDKSFEWGVKKAAEIGYEYVEPMVHWGRELLSEAGYFHSVSMYDDPLWMKEVCDKHGIKISGLSSHTPLCKPEISVEYLKMAIRYAAAMGVPVVNTDEGPKPAWTTKEMDYTLMKYTLTEASIVAERHGVSIGLEQHQQYSTWPEGLKSIFELVDSPAIGYNFDTGNAFIGGKADIYEWLENIKHNLVHLHAKDIGIGQSSVRGEVTGVPVGCACGDGVVDWKRVIDIVKTVDREIVFSVECGTVEQAVRSFEHLSTLL
ncbi:Sugar phosphate isomerase/epimerase [Mariniphaga anaerophila]|uniref:Sugar phosphate isomerase/epimerase n=1 Tax=Mariniphaga anaerophila TaxID=1484053 RepID=A0A1M4UDS2_9BACT|nr:sugar phosphate isomerase/epimerase [Mariniphaga anaerophila]SHE54834.1 Sugar phosphate isomerase/epimerase [Mariniphaga anaerophila]